MIWAEQGIGDEVMFLRFLPLLEQLPFQFTLEFDGRLISILEFNYPWLKFMPRTSILDFRQFQYHLPIGDLLRIFFKRTTEISHQFLKARTNEKIDQVLAGHLGKSFIGLSWLSMSEDYGIRRSLPAETFLRELDPQHVVIVSLRYLAPKTEIAKIRTYGFQVINEIDCYQDIDAVFSIMPQCDKVMTIDNSVAHFAGAL